MLRWLVTALHDSRGLALHFNALYAGEGPFCYADSARESRLSLSSGLRFPPAGEYLATSWRDTTMAHNSYLEWVKIHRPHHPMLRDYKAPTFGGNDMAGSVHNVNDYAPPGYKLAATHYADGKCTHVFSADGQNDVHVHISQHDDELKVLESFKAGHSLPVADTLPAPEYIPPYADPKTGRPTKRKGGNGG